MKRNVGLKSLLSVLVMLAVLMVFSLASYAAPDAVKPVPVEVPKAITADADATLMANGNVSVNGNAAKTGITVLSGSTVTTGANSIAMIESPAFGRVTMGANTIAKITYAAGILKIESTCDDMRVACKEGECSVTAKNGLAKILTTGQDEHFAQAVDVASKNFVDVVINCGTDVVCPPPIAPVVARNTFGLLGILLLGGAATGITIGVIAGGGSTKPRRQPVSGFQP
ncbi:MAG: hypothetical protein HY231_16370 [Acidobacteria bacterium]|nr:hypothetical protein [Acidobacteriota bacterium]